jgi:hypothetical protein
MEESMIEFGHGQAPVRPGADPRWAALMAAEMLRIVQVKRDLDLEYPDSRSELTGEELSGIASRALFDRLCLPPGELEEDDPDPEFLEGPEAPMCNFWCLDYALQ